MKQIISIAAIAIMICSLLSTSCSNQVQETEEPAKIENTLQSVRYFQDTVGYAPQLLFELFKKYIDVGKHELPQKVFINGHNLKVKVFVDEWDLKTKKFISVLIYKLLFPSFNVLFR